MKILIFVAITVFIAGCATSYQPYSYFGGGGYKDIQLSENSFKITVEANGYTKKSEAVDLALLRAADLTLEKGFKHFIIVGSADETYQTNFTTPRTTTLNLTTNSTGATGTAQTYGGQTFNIVFPTPVITILTFKDKPAIAGTVYDAAITSRSLRTQLNVK